MQNRELLLSSFHAALTVAKPEGRFTELPDPPQGKVIVLGAGKAAASMAAAFETAWFSKHSNTDLTGLVVTRYDHSASTTHIKVVEASHPVPDKAGQDAAKLILKMAICATKDDLVVFLISGGASALLTLPVDGLEFESKQAINKQLLKAGTPIDEMNIVRQSLSSIKGGRLGAAASNAQTITYLISDVPGDAPEIIGSGPTVNWAIPPTERNLKALEILDRYQIQINDETRALIKSNLAEPFQSGPVHILATPQMSLEAASNLLSNKGYKLANLGDAIEGEAKDVAKVLAAMCRQILTHHQPFKAPIALLSGGETTVTVKGTGRGGRNTEFLLALAIAIDAIGDAAPRISAIACDTDGVDGIETNAGAFVDGNTVKRAHDLGLNAQAYLDNNDAFSFFAELQDLVTTGPTLTNVNDFRLILID